MNFCVSSISSLNFKCAALKMDTDRKSIIDRCAKGRTEATGKDKGKYTEESAAMETSA